MLAVFIAACGDDDEESSSSSGSSSTSTTKKPEAGGSAGDLKVLNYALTLEHLESDFYKQVIESGVIKDAAVVSIAKKFGETEAEHVEVLTATVKKLGGTPAQAPKTKFQEIIDGGPEKILETAAAVENLGAAAYLGAAGKIENKEVLAAALSIHSVEARHAAALNQLIGKGFKGTLPDGAFAKGMDEKAVLAAVQPFIAS